MKQLLARTVLALLVGGALLLWDAAPLVARPLAAKPLAAPNMGAKAYGLGGPSLAQTVQAKSRRSADISGALSRLANNPKYRGRVLGTHIRNTRRGFVYEVRILRPDDRVILVYIDPETGGVVGDSASGGRRFSGPEGRSVKPSMPGFRQNTDRGGPLGGQRR